MSQPIRCQLHWRFSGASRFSEAAAAAAAGMRTIHRQADQPILTQALVAASDKLTADFGKWQTPWGDINRFQRMNDDIVAKFDDSQPSIPVMFPAARGVRSLRSPRGRIPTPRMVRHERQ